MPLRIISVKLDVDVIVELDAIANSLKVSRSELIRRAIDEYLKRIRAGEEPDKLKIRDAVRVVL